MGFRPVRYIGGAPYTGSVNRYFVQSSDGTAIGIGDLVKFDGGSDTKGVPSVTRALASDNTATGSVCVGVVVGVEVSTPVSGSVALDLPQYRKASTAAYVLVADDPDLVFEAQEDAVGGALAVASVGLNANFIDANPSATTGQSGMQVDTSTAATTAGLALRIIGFSTSVENEPGVANAKVLVKINKHAYAEDAAGVAGV
jgi:hypothetical protein